MLLIHELHVFRLVCTVQFVCVCVKLGKINSVRKGNNNWCGSQDCQSGRSIWKFFVLHFAFTLLFTDTHPVK